MPCYYFSGPQQPDVVSCDVGCSALWSLSRPEEEQLKNNIFWLHYIIFRLFNVNQKEMVLLVQKTGRVWNEININNHQLRLHNTNGLDITEGNHNSLIHFTSIKPLTTTDFWFPLISQNESNLSRMKRKKYALSLSLSLVSSLLPPSLV